MDVTDSVGTVTGENESTYSQVKTRTSIHHFIKQYPIICWISGGWLTVMILTAIIAPILTPFDYTELDLTIRLLRPGDTGHLFGTDHLGRDVFSRLLISVRLSMLVATLGTVIGAVLGTVLGMLAAHFSGILDDLVMVLVDFQASIPFMIIALTILAFLGNNLTIFIIVLGFQGWEKYARIARGMTMSALGQGYAEAVRSLGVPSVRIYWRHILPNIASALIVNMTLNFPETILWESSLSFLGLGVQPPMTSLGSMLGYGRDYLMDAWWISISPGVIIFITTLAMSLFGDWLRDRLDPSLK
jgi:peptide/nickel transport system permease protein